MPWAKQTPLVWEWKQEECAPNNIANRCNELVESRWIVKFVVGPIGGELLRNPNFIIVSCQGTPKKAATKKKPELE